ncbi:MAG TPA: HDOD domain-containing protein [Fimbriimonadaceae bacterium]|nr:HDOD domain-containing protein [Fimbriimonadaceae bacterium]
MELRSLEIKISRSENLPVLPQIASSVLHLVDDPDSSARQMEQLIMRDSAIAAKILRVANSSYYGLSQVTSINRAISILGINTVRSLVVGISYQQMIATRQSSTQFSRVEFWRHSVAVATAAKILGKLKMPARAEELYSAALMHDVGLLVLDRFAPQQLDEAFVYATEQHIMLHQAEQLLFDFDHAQIGGLLATRWGMTGALKDAIQFHHAPWDSEEHSEFTAFVTVADLLAHQCGYDNNIANETVEIDSDLLGIVGLPAEQLDPIKAVIVNEIRKAEEALKINVGAKAA